MTNHVDAAIAKLNDKIAVLRLAIAELENARDAAPVAEERKTRKPRQKRIGLSSVTPPASEANHVKGDARL